MENRKLIRIIPILILGFSVFTNNVLAYGVETHAFLTKEVLRFYNQHFPNQSIIEELQNYIIDGARLEDNMPRYLNHFYDPVNDIGLADLGSRGQKSKEWAQDKTAQTAFLHRVFPQTEASILSVAQIEKIQSAYNQTDFTWQKAVELYAGGKKEEAFFALGHILHLIEDASVPDHTRNDAHPPYDNGGSPYENWTRKFDRENPDKNLSLRLFYKDPILLNSLDSYFNAMAGYSNNNFYSRDSIVKYENPQPVDFVESNYSLPGYVYGLFNDGEGKFRLVLGQEKDYFSWMVNDTTDNRIRLVNNQLDQFVIKDYWFRLSVKAVQYGAGVIDLFFKEVEKAKNDPNFVKEEPKSFLAQMVESGKDLVAGVVQKARTLLPNFDLNFGAKDSDFQLVAEIPLDKREVGNKIDKDQIAVSDDSGGAENKNVGKRKSGELNKANSEAKKNDDSASIQNNEEIPPNQEEIKRGKDAITDNQPTISLRPAATMEKQQVQNCSFNTDKTPIRDRLVFNEIAWMGTFANANNEWIELKNISGAELNISGWQILDKDEQIKITLSGGAKLAAGGLMLLERTDDNSLPSISADLTYAGALSNTDEGLRLFNSKCDLADEVFVNSNWPAGESGARRTMERSSDFAWHTYSGNGENFGKELIMGTPKKENSPVIIFQSGGVNLENDKQQKEDTEQQKSDSQQPAKILISEVQITGGTGKANNDFVEFYNPNDAPFNLNGYRLVKRTKTGVSDTSMKSWIADTLIPAKGYYLWANSDYIDIALTPDATTTATLSNDNGVAVRFGAENTGAIIDSVGWGEAQNNFVESQPFNENPIANQSISRQSESDTDNNANDFIKSKPTPKNSSVSGGFLSPESWDSQTAAPLSHIVISEAYPDRTGANQDFVELYNPNDVSSSDIDISGWSLQILSANATSTEKIIKKNFEAGNKIPSRGFFLIGIDNYVAPADMSWLSGSLNSVDGATIFLVAGTSTIADFEDSRIVDQIAYGSGSGLMAPETAATPLPIAGWSLERKAAQNDNCASSQSVGEFLGNACDTDNNANDFELRASPNPQGLSNYPEPRALPTAVSNFQTAYSSTTMGILLSWQPSQDYKGATSTVKYTINYATSSAPDLKKLAVLTATTTYKFKINEVGVAYNFSIIAQDQDGLSSNSNSAAAEIPSFLTNLYLYPDTQFASTTALELKYDHYPLAPNLYWEGTGWQVIIFYLNKESPALPYFYSDQQYAGTPDGIYPKQYGEWGSNIGGALKLKYPDCAAGSSSLYTAFILPDGSDRCNPGYGGVRRLAFDWGKVGTSTIKITSAPDYQSPLVSGDYVTAAFYAYGGNNNQVLIAVDRQKYYFQNTAP